VTEALLDVMDEEDQPDEQQPEEEDMNLEIM
jgi:hypothetical protein